MGVPAELEYERQANKLRESPIYKEARERFDKIARDQALAKVQVAGRTTISDEISAVEADARLYRPKKGSQPLPTVSYVFKCRGCGSDLPRGCPSRVHTHISPLTGKIVRERPFPCPACKESPWAEPERQGAPDVNASFKPYWDVSLSRHALRPKGMVYIKGRGHRVESLSQLREFARMNGREYR